MAIESWLAIFDILMSVFLVSLTCSKQHLIIQNCHPCLNIPHVLNTKNQGMKSLLQWYLPELCLFIYILPAFLNDYVFKTKTG